MEHQILRRSTPDPTRKTVGRHETVVHYYHTDTKEYLGTEMYDDKGVLFITRVKNPPLCTITVCHCSECLREANR